MDTGKIEERAIGALNNLIDDHPTMMSGVMAHDKYMSWDGEIVLFKDDDKNRTKENRYDSIPVQVKGHIDKTGKYFNQESIKYSVEIRDLQLYYDNYGCVYFQIFIDENNKEKYIYYNSLYPSKIKSLLDLAIRKNIKSTTITFYSVKNYKELDRILKQFSLETHSQGSGRGQIVPKTIGIDQLKGINTITFQTYYRDELELIKHITNGDICIYAESGTGINIPIEWNQGIKLCSVKELEKSVLLKGKEYYKSYRVKHAADDTYEIQIGSCISIDISGGIYNFSPIGGIYSMCYDAWFLKELLETEMITIAGIDIPFEKPKVSKDLSSTLNYLADIKQIFDDMKFYPKENVETMSLEIKNQVNTLYDFTHGKYDDLLENEWNIFNWKYGDKYVPIIVKKDKHNQKTITQVLYGYDYAVFCEQDNQKRVPIVSTVKTEILNQLFYYDYDWFKYDLYSAALDLATIGYINDVGLKYLALYDKTDNKDFLQLAKWAFERVESFDDSLPYIIINKYQTIVRERELEKTEKQNISKINDDNPAIMFAKSVLLSDLQGANKYYSILNEDELNQIREYPIMKLYKELVV